MHIVLVVNTTAASVTTRRRRRAAGALAEVASVQVVETTHRGHGTELAAAAVREGADAVVVLGGDGTLNEVAASLVGTQVALGALPGGSTSVFARTIGLPRDTVAAAEVLGRALVAGSVRQVGLGRAGARWFALHTGIGWDAAVVQLVERRPAAKRRFGQLPFVAAALRTFGGAYDRNTPHFEVHFDDGEVIDDAFMSLALNSDPYTFVGARPFTVAPGVDLDSGLAVVTLTSLRLVDFVPDVIAALGSEGIERRQGVEVREGISGVTFRRRTTMPHQVDGDFCGDVGELRCTHHPAALRLLVPPGER